MKRNLILFAGILLLSVFAAQAQSNSKFDSLSLSEAGQKSYEKLLSAAIFRIGAVGEFGITSKEELALHNLLKEKNALEALISLGEQAAPEGSLYALLGFRFKDENLFKSEIEKYKSLPEPLERENAVFEIKIQKGFVLTQSGCKLIREKRLQVITQIEAGKYDEAFKLSEREAAVSN